ncbi:MAG TPA: DsbA family oxidoreductase [Burkholderiaceae bacterium]|nr:DsbA family oxidoreductase [Burkholderiaceae bacterium]
MSNGSDDSAAGHTITIDVVSDVVCPWCFIGKRQLEEALAQWRARHPDRPAPQVNWRPFQLNPDMPPGGMLREDYLVRKFGRSDVGRIYENVRRAAGEVGLSLNLEAVVRQPNTLKPHVLMQAAGERGVQPRMAEKLFTAYFLEGRDLTDDAVLAQIAREAGLDDATITAALTDERLREIIAGQDEEAREAGVSGVPFFIFDQRLAVSGAQGAQRLMMALDKADALAGTPTD